MADPIIIAALVTWWTFAVAALAIFVAAKAPKTDDREILAAAVFWPVTAPIFLCLFLYSTTVWSGNVIRVDLRNRKLLREFDEFMAQRKAAQDKEPTDG